MRCDTRIIRCDMLQVREETGMSMLIPKLVAADYNEDEARRALALYADIIDEGVEKRWTEEAICKAIIEQHAKDVDEGKVKP